MIGREIFVMVVGFAAGVAIYYNAKGIAAGHRRGERIINVALIVSGVAILAFAVRS